MSAGDTLVGRRRTARARLGNLRPGDYRPAPNDPRGPGVWYCRTPTGTTGAIIPANHSVVEHGDGAITVTPSLHMTHGDHWHGYLTAGVWREV